MNPCIPVTAANDDARHSGRGGEATRFLDGNDSARPVAGNHAEGRISGRQRFLGQRSFRPRERNTASQASWCKQCRHTITASLWSAKTRENETAVGREKL